MWIPRLPKPSASNVRPVKVDSLDPQAQGSRINRDRRELHVTRIKRVQRAHRVSLVRHTSR